MDISEIVMIGGFAVSIGSMSIAVLRLNNNHKKNGNNSKEFVRRPECHIAMEGLKDFVGAKFDGLESKVDTAIDLLKNGK